MFWRESSEAEEHVSAWYWMCPVAESLGAWVSYPQTRGFPSFFFSFFFKAGCIPHEQIFKSQAIIIITNYEIAADAAMFSARNCYIFHFEYKAIKSWL